jgi:hypothetical protein
MPQVKRDFDAALRRAGQNKTDNDDQPSDKLDPSDRMCPNLTVLGTLAPMPPGSTTAAQATSSDAALGGAGTMTVLPNTCRGTLPDAAPITAGAVATPAADQQWRIHIPGNDPSSSAMAVRLINSGTGQWQVRLAADSPTRLQLTPGLGQLRDKLRRSSGHRIDDLEFDDDLGSESDADTQP